MIKYKPTFLLFVPLLLSSCSNAINLNRSYFYFDTYIQTTLYQGEESDLDDIDKIFSYYDKISDNYLARDTFNIYSLNQDNEPHQIDEDFYDLLKVSFDYSSYEAKYFNPLTGSLAKKWKNALKNSQLLDENTINEELEKINNSSFSLLEGNYVKRNGEAEIDLGGIVKGYALDKVYDYLKEKDYKNYLINGGSSSILLGEKNNSDGYFNVGISDVSGAYIKAKNCFVSTSSISRQGVTIEDITYSHIINPFDGSAINPHDAVLVLSDKGYIGDALSTSFMLSSVEEIKQVEISQNVKSVVIEKEKVVYCHPDIEVQYH